MLVVDMSLDALASAVGERAKLTAERFFRGVHVHRVLARILHRFPTHVAQTGFLRRTLNVLVQSPDVMAQSGGGRKRLVANSAVVTTEL